MPLIHGIIKLPAKYITLLTLTIIIVLVNIYLFLLK